MNWTLLECSKVAFLLNNLIMAILCIFVIWWSSQCILNLLKKEEEKRKKSLNFGQTRFSSLLIQRSALLLVRREGFFCAVLIIGSCTDRSLKLALLWHCVIGYSFFGAVIWSMGSNFKLDVCGGGVTLVHRGVSDVAVWQWYEEKGAFTHTLFTKELTSLMMSFHHWKLSW